MTPKARAQEALTVEQSQRKNLDRLYAEGLRDQQEITALKRELFTAQRQYANAQRNFEYYYDLYRKVSGKTIAECEKQWSVDTLDGQIGLEKHAAAVKRGEG